MLLSSSLSLSPALLASALAKGVKHASRTFLASVKCHAFVNGAPQGVAPYASPEVLSGAFLFRFELNGANMRGAQELKVFVLDNAKLAKGLAKLAAMDPGAFGRIADGKGKVSDCVAMLQLGLFGAEWYDSEA